MGQKKNLSTFDVAEMLEVDPGSVANWIDGGLLRAHRTPGGHRRVAVDDLVAFLREHDMPCPAQLQPGPIRVVIVDDEPAMTQMIAKAIKTEHPEYETAQAHDGFRAGAIVATLKPDVVILDLRMPGMDGFEVCRMIKSQPATRHATVIAITAYPAEESTRRILDCGAKICLSKPLSLADLVAQVQVGAREARG
jgi:excisionase family DNA binding protein